MIRQICDGRGSFVSATKEFAEFRDVVFWSSFSLSPFGYPRLSSRLLRHFSMVGVTALCTALSGGVTTFLYADVAA